jgi:LacI family transcriptional regulator
MRRSDATTLQDVARAAGVSAMTVSVVLNGARSATRVSEATRARILEAAAQLKYRPNAAARGLQRRRMDTIGVVAVVDGGEVNLYFLEVLNGILEAAARNGQNATVFSIADWEKDEARITGFCDGRVDGMIFIAPCMTVEMAAALQSHTPFVTIHSDRILPNVWNLDVDNESGAREATQRLILQGHRRIAHFTGQLDLLGARQRLNGYRGALVQAGIPLDESLIIPCGYSATAGHYQMNELLENRSDANPLPTAIFCASDAIAQGCLEALTERGLSAPQDISLIGFDDTLAARMTNPPLTTVRQPFRTLGSRAVELLLPQIPGGAEASASVIPHTEIAAVELVVRGSDGPPPTP